MVSPGATVHSLGIFGLTNGQQRVVDQVDPAGAVAKGFLGDGTDVVAQQHPFHHGVLGVQLLGQALLGALALRELGVGRQVT